APGVPTRRRQEGGKALARPKDGLARAPNPLARTGLPRRRLLDDRPSGGAGRSKRVPGPHHPHHRRDRTARFLGNSLGLRGVPADVPAVALATRYGLGSPRRIAGFPRGTAARAELGRRRVPRTRSCPLRVGPAAYPPDAA